MKLILILQFSLLSFVAFGQNKSITKDSTENDMDVINRFDSLDNAPLGTEVRIFQRIEEKVIAEPQPKSSPPSPRATTSSKKRKPKAVRFKKKKLKKGKLKKCRKN